MSCKHWRQTWRASGFTLVELMVVIVLIGLLAGAVALGTRSYLVAGKQAVAKLEISRICQALDTFFTAYDRYPTNDEGIAILALASALSLQFNRIQFTPDLMPADITGTEVIQEDRSTGACTVT